MAKKQKYPKEFVELCASVTAKRPKTVIDHLLKHGHITTEELKNKYGFGGTQPVLSVAKAANAAAIISWPVSATDFVLEVTDKLAPANWAASTLPIVVSGDRNTVTVTASGGNSFYRLRK